MILRLLRGCAHAGSAGNTPAGTAARRAMLKLRRLRDVLLIGSLLVA
jgi:hypothetical protein